MAKLRPLVVVAGFCAGLGLVAFGLGPKSSIERPKPEIHYQSSANLRYFAGYQRCDINDYDNDQKADSISLGHGQIGVYDVAFIAPGYENRYDHDALKKLPLDETMRKQATEILTNQNYLQFNVETSLWEADKQKN